MWVLVATLMMWGEVNGLMPLTVPNFTTKAACETAGHQLKQAWDERLTYVCLALTEDSR